MFFDAPVTAFANIRRALKPNGRLVFLCWRELKESSFFRVPLEAALKHVPSPEPLPPRAPGPFAFAEADYVRDILRDAGLQNVAASPVNAELSLRASPQEAADFFIGLGGVRRLVEGLPKTALVEVKAEIVAALKQHEGPSGIALGGAAWIVSARNKP
jgi:SAM-dependent methyltransferase